ncbi:MAG: type III-B CRISPR module RAMP protein Cmr6 [Desulfobacterales bacterium]|nr:type III-B CRISPR module RAMP protein Cmr6 [Desulfobacterales bacterium]
MTYPEFKRLNDLESPNPGLVLDKLGLHLVFSDRNQNQNEKSLQIREKKETRDEKYPGDRETVFEAVCRAFRNPKFRKLYQDYYDDWMEKLFLYQKKQKAKILKGVTKSRFTTGFSNSAAMQTGFAFHYTYGVPYIPGSSVKGACRSFAEETDVSLYGSEPWGKKAGPALFPGQVVFADAMPEIDTVESLEIDVMTPHHIKYYMGNEQYKSAPDVENPVPVKFVTVPEGSVFVFPFISEDQKLLDIVEKHWKSACSSGFGAKTSSGYGWFKPVTR